MKKLKFTFRLLTLALMFFAYSGFSQDVGPIEITIDVAPATLNLSNSGTVVTVHTNIAYSAVEGASVSMNGVEISWWKSDNKGYFVAKFNIDDVKVIVTPGPCLLKMEGLTKTGVEFSGEQQITVTNVKK
jgi:hypothetical protein